MAGNKSLKAAVRAKEDEFYTQLTDIEKELRHYKQHFRGKTILCNCDDPFESNFFKYFVLNFNRLGIKKLIATCYSGSPIANQQLSLFDVLGSGEENANKPYKAIVTQVYDQTGDGGVDIDIGIERRHCIDHGRENVHGVGTLREVVEEVAHIFVYHAVQVEHT